jgi:hypothetical protein
MISKKINPLQYQADVYFKDEYFDDKNPHPGETLFKTLDFCFQAGIDVPEWTKAEFRRCYAKYVKRIGSEPLTVAFDTDREAGKHKESKRRKQQHFNTVCHTLWHLHINENKPIDEALFEEVAKRHAVKGLGASTVKNLFYDEIRPMLKRFGGFPICPEFVKPNFQKD